MSKTKQKVKNGLFRLPILVVLWFIMAGAIAPLFLAGHASAGQLATRKLSIDSAQPAQTLRTYTYTFTPSATAISSVKFVECTTATSTYGFASTSSTTGCTAPTGCVGTNCLNQGTGSGFTAPNGWTNTTTPTRQTSTLNNCAPANNVLCITRTAGSAETAVAHTFSWNTQTNPSTANSTFYIGIYTYSDASFVTPVDSGTVASAVVQTLTVSATIAEVLMFCAGSTTADTATATMPSDCSGVTGTGVGLGNLDSTKVNVSPVASGNGGDTFNGLLMLRSNAANGTSITYDAILDSTGAAFHQGTLRVQGTTTCTASVVTTDQCFNTSTTQATFPSGTEAFGMTIAAVDCDSVSATSYSCSFASGTYHLTRDSAYDGTGSNTYPSDTGLVSGTTNAGYAWQETGASTALASSTNAVDDEALILKFAATPSITTPFGSYSVKTDYIAVPTY